MPDDVRISSSTLHARTGNKVAAAESSGPRPKLATRMAIIVVPIGVVLGAHPVSDPSPRLHPKVGAFLLNGGRFGLPDRWAPFATRTYVPTEWLPAIVGQQTYQAFGLPSVAWMRCAGILALLSALVWSAHRSADIVAAVVVAFVAIVGAHNGLTEHPQLFG